MKNWLLLTILPLLMACGEKSRAVGGRGEDRLLQDPLLNLSCLYTEGEQNMSFPLWFNDSLIKARGILEIKRTVFDDSVTDSTEVEQILPKKEFTYLFDEDGKVSSLEIKNFYDSKMISSVKIQFSKHQKTTGFAITRFNDQLDYDHTEFPFRQYEEVKRTSVWSCYQEVNSMDLLYIIRDEKYWKPLTIDTLCYPDKNDLLILGTYEKPHKKYKVENIVEEKDVKNYTYEGTVLTRIDWVEDPFTVSRTLRFDPGGTCVGFVDSTFSVGDYVSAVNYRFDLKQSLPQTVTRSVNRDEGEVVILREQFTYRFK